MSFQSFDRNAIIPVAEIWESPDIAQTHGVPQQGKQEVKAAGPVASLFILVDTIQLLPAVLCNIGGECVLDINGG